MLLPPQLRSFGRLLPLPTLGAAALLLAGCAGPAPSPAAPAAPAGGQAAAQPKVNRVVFGVEAPAVEGNELRNLSPADFFPLRPMYEHLIGVDPVSGKSVPYLATEWNLLPDGLSFSFKLRQGVPLHNGYGDFSSQDVVASWQEILKKDSLHGVAPYWQDALNAIDTPSPGEAVFRLKRPDGNFLITLSEMTGGIEPFSKAQLDKQGPATMQSGPIAGTGPYQFKERAQGRYIRFERTPYKHWRVTPDFPEFEFRFMKEASTRMASLLTNEIHVASLPQDLLGQAEKQGMKVVQGRVPALRTYFLPYCCAQKDPKDPSKGYLYPEDPLTDVRVRKALSKAVNRDELNKAFFAGKGQPMALDPFHPTRPGWNPEWEKRAAAEYGYDPVAAKALLAQAGFTPEKPLTTTFIVAPAAGYSGGEDVIEAVAGMWRAIGVDAKLETMDGETLKTQGRALKLTNRWELVGTASWLWTGITARGSTLGPRAGRIELADADRLLAQVSDTLDEQKQDGLWRQVGDVMFEQHKAIPLFWLPVEAAINPAFVSDYVFGGYNSGAWTHVYNIKAAR